MNVAVIALGLVALVVLATMVGKAGDSRARDRAWRRIAIERRRNWEQRRDLDIALPCSNPNCPFRKFDEQPPGDSRR